MLKTRSCRETSEHSYYLGEAHSKQTHVASRAGRRIASAHAPWHSLQGSELMLQWLITAPKCEITLLAQFHGPDFGEGDIYPVHIAYILNIVNVGRT